MTIEGNQLVTGEKIFDSDIHVYGDIIMQDGKTVDGVDLSELRKDVAYHNVSYVITGNKHFRNLTVGNLTIFCKNNCSDSRCVNKSSSNCSFPAMENITSVCERKTNCQLVQLLEDLNLKTWKRTKPANVSGTKTFVSPNVYVNPSLTVDGFINNIKMPQDLALRRGNQTIHGDKTFKNKVMIEGDIQAYGLVNNVNVSDMYLRAMTLDSTQNITGLKTFLNDVHVRKDLNLTGSIDGLDISSHAVTLKDDQIISGEKTFDNSVSVEKLYVESMEVEGLVDGVNVTDLDDKILRVSGNQTISGNVTFDSDLLVDGNLTINEDLNGIKISDLKNLMTVDGDQIITGRKVSDIDCS